MLRSILLALASTPLVACAATVERGVNTTEAAPQMQQVPRSRTNELDPAISPDGKTIAYEVADTLDSTPRVEVVALQEAVSAGPRPRLSTSPGAGGLAP